MAGGHIALALALFVAGQTNPNPCPTGEPPSVTCQDALADAALTWEKRYHEERSAHLTTLQVCAQMNSETPPIPQQPDVQHNPLTTFLWISGALVAVIGAFTIGAVAF